MKPTGRVFLILLRDRIFGTTGPFNAKRPRHDWRKPCRPAASGLQFDHTSGGDNGTGFAN